MAAVGAAEDEAEQHRGAGAQREVGGGARGEGLLAEEVDEDAAGPDVLVDEEADDLAGLEQRGASRERRRRWPRQRIL